jgi:hypothetical protein
MAHTGVQPKEIRKKSRFGPWANLGFDGHPRPRSAGRHVLDGMPAATRGGDAPL